MRSKWEFLLGTRGLLLRGLLRRDLRDVLCGASSHHASAADHAPTDYLTARDAPADNAAAYDSASLRSRETLRHDQGR